MTYHDRPKISQPAAWTFGMIGCNWCNITLNQQVLARIPGKFWRRPESIVSQMGMVIKLDWNHGGMDGFLNHAISLTMSQNTSCFLFESTNIWFMRSYQIHDLWYFLMIFALTNHCSEKYILLTDSQLQVTQYSNGVSLRGSYLPPCTPKWFVTVRCFFFVIIKTWCFRWFSHFSYRYIGCFTKSQLWFSNCHFEPTPWYEFPHRFGFISHDQRCPSRYLRGLKKNIHQFDISTTNHFVDLVINQLNAIWVITTL